MNMSAVPGARLILANWTKKAPNSWGDWAYRKHSRALSRTPSWLVRRKREGWGIRGRGREREGGREEDRGREGRERPRDREGKRGGVHRRGG